MKQALWWAYERSPAGLDRLFHAGRRHVMPLLRHRLPVRRLIGPAGPERAMATLITTGEAMTLDVLAGAFFAEPPRCEDLGRVSLLRLPAVLDELSPDADLVLACVPRILVGRFDDRYLRVPSLVEARLPLAGDLTATLAHASHTIRYEARRALASGYDWSFSRDLADFERFYDDFYQPFVQSRFGPLGVVRERQVLRRHFRHQGGIIWLRHGGRVVAGELARQEGRRLRAMVEALKPDWPEDARPTPQYMLKFADCVIALEMGLDEVDFGASVPSLRNGPLRSKRAWGVRFANYGDSHRDILLRWQAPCGAAMHSFLAENPLLFESPLGLQVLTATPPGDVTDHRSVRRLRNGLLPHGITRLHVLNGGAPAEGPAGLPDDTAVWDPASDARAINRLAAGPPARTGSGR
ncbi:GNAT family N-acetyltransferase [Geminicoccus roseus]|uniref:GNAT family N-acetyltransferase n=1 Tax=Geminicoccus roseus TaxID=404900 RepID=UPI000427C8B1|nr:GNAT family N-acetyltransferase [Geminicoccus roseus]